MAESVSRMAPKPTMLASEAQSSMPLTSLHRVEADGIRVFYRAGGSAKAPVVLLLHGFPTSSFMFRDLIPRRANDYYVIAPDLPGFGFTEVPAERNYVYSFDRFALSIETFTQALKLNRYAIYVFDYGAPIGFRLAMAHPEKVTAIVTQNGTPRFRSRSTPTRIWIPTADRTAVDRLDAIPTRNPGATGEAEADSTAEGK